MYALPQENISYAKKRNEERLSPYSAHAQFASDLLLLKIVFQDTEQKQFTVGSSNAIAVDVAIHRNLDIGTETQLDVFSCRVPISLITKRKKAS